MNALECDVFEHLIDVIADRNPTDDPRAGRCRRITILPAIFGQDVSWQVLGMSKRILSILAWVLSTILFTNQVAQYAYVRGKAESLPTLVSAEGSTYLKTRQPSISLSSVRRSHVFLT